MLLLAGDIGATRTDLAVYSAERGPRKPLAQAEFHSLPWEIDDTTLRQALGLTSLRLLNDLEAIARAVPILKSDDLHTLNSGEPVPA
jgi:glucokinase